MAIGKFLTPPQLARQHNIKPEKVIGWINSGELRAVNISNGTQRPRWRIAEEWFEEFLERRASAAAPAKKRRRKRRADVVEHV